MEHFLIVDLLHSVLGHTSVVILIYPMIMQSVKHKGKFPSSWWTVWWLFISSVTSQLRDFNVPSYSNSVSQWLFFFFSSAVGKYLHYYYYFLLDSTGWVNVDSSVSAAFVCANFWVTHAMVCCREQRKWCAGVYFPYLYLCMSIFYVPHIREE